MTDAVVFTPGQKGADGTDPQELFKEKYETTVLGAYSTSAVTANVFMNKTDITGNKAAEFPVGGVTGGGYHIPGTEILGQEGFMESVKIELDPGFLISDSFTSDWYELQNNIDTWTYIAKQQGVFLAKLNDYANFATVYKAAKSPANIPGETQPGKTIVVGTEEVLVDGTPTQVITANTLEAAIADAVVHFDTSGVPSTDRVVFLPFELRQMLIRSRNIADNRFGSGVSITSNTLKELYGIDIIGTNHIPQKDLSTQAKVDASGYFPKARPGAFAAKYRADYSKVLGFATQRECIGVLKGIEPTLVVQPQPHRMGTLFYTKTATGRGVLRPECAVVFEMA